MVDNVCITIYIPTIIYCYTPWLWFIQNIFLVSHPDRRGFGPARIVCWTQLDIAYITIARTHQAGHINRISPSLHFSSHPHKSSGEQPTDCTLSRKYRVYTYILYFMCLSVYTLYLPIISPNNRQQYVSLQLSRYIYIGNLPFATLSSWPRSNIRLYIILLKPDQQNGPK